MRFGSRFKEYRVIYTVYWHIPTFGYSWNASFMYISVLLQNPFLIFGRHWDVILGSWGYPDGSVAVRIAQRLGVPALVKVHGSDLNVIAELPQVRSVIAEDLKKADVVVTVSQALRDKVIALSVPESRVSVVYNGVDRSKFYPRSKKNCRHQLGLDKKRGFVLYVGNLYKTKGVLDLLESFIAVADSRPDLELVFVGSGPCRSAILERALSTGLSSRIRLIGSVDHRDLPIWFNAASVLCLPSYNEGVPNVVLEAIACDTPVIATRVGGIPEVLSSDRGVLIAAGDLAALASALSAVDHPSPAADHPQTSVSILSWQESSQALSDAISLAITNHA